MNTRTPTTPPKREPFKLESRQAAIPIVRLWLLRMLVPLGTHKEFIAGVTKEEDLIIQALGLEHWIEQEECWIEDELDKKSALKELTKLHRAAEKELKIAKVPDPLANNIKQIATLAGLSDMDCRILECATLLRAERSLAHMVENFAPLNNLWHHQDVASALSALLALPQDEICLSLGKNSVLTKLGLVQVELDFWGSQNLRDILELPHGFANRVVSATLDSVDLLQGMAFPSPPPLLTTDDYPHLEPELAFLLTYLKKSLATSYAGVNILLYGPTGTGKTQLTRVLAQGLDCELFQVAMENKDGDPLEGSERLRAYGRAQHFFANSKTGKLLVFNKVDNIAAAYDESSVQRMLEDNPTPAFWLANSLESLSEGLIRRFDLAVSLPVPPQQQRERILRQAGSGFLDKQAAARLSGMEKLPPAVVTRAAAMVSSVSEGLGKDGASAAFELIVNNTLAAQEFGKCSP